MTVYPVRKQKNNAMGILGWLLVFILGIILIFGHVRLYELEVEIREKEAALQEVLPELGDVKKIRKQQLMNLEAYAAEMGLYLPSYEDYVVVSVGR